MKKFINILLLSLLVFATSANARVLNSTEEITLQTPAGFGIFMDSPSVSASLPLKLGGSKELVSSAIDVTSSSGEVTGILDITNGGTGSATQNFVDLTTNQSIAGEKTFTGKLITSTTSNGAIPCPVMTEVQRDAIVGAVEGDCVYNSDTNLINVYDGATWQLVGGVSGLNLNELTFGDASGGLDQSSNLTFISSSALLDILNLQIDGTNSQINGIAGANFISGSAPSTPTSGNISLFNDSSNSLLSYVDSNGISRTVRNELPVHAISNHSFESSHAGDPDLGWTCTNGTGSVETTNIAPASGSQALQYDLTAETWSCSQTFSCSNYRAGTVLGFTVKADSAAGGFEVCGYDGSTATNCVSVEPGSGYQTYLAETVAATTCGVIIRSPLANTGTIYIDQVEFTDTPYKLAKVTATKEWSSYTPVFSGFGTVSNVDFRYAQVGDAYHIIGSFDAGTVAASEAQIGLPNGDSVTSAFTQIQIVGDMGRGSASGARNKFVAATAGDTFLNITNQVNGAEVPANGNGVVANGEGVTINAIVPIEGISAIDSSVIFPSPSANSPLGFPFDTVQENILSSDLTSVTQDAADLTFTGLVVDDCYGVGGQLSKTHNNNVIEVQFRDAASGAGNLYHNAYSNTSISNTQLPHGLNFKFKASSTSLYAYLNSGGTTVLNGDGTTAETYVQLTRLKTTTCN